MEYGWTKTDTPWQGAWHTITTTSEVSGKSLVFRIQPLTEGENSNARNDPGYTPSFRRAVKEATSFELVATRGATTNGICSNPFLEYAFKTVEYRIKVTISLDGRWAYDEDTVLMVRGQSEPFHHTDRSILTKIGEPTPNPLARGQGIATLGSEGDNRNSDRSQQSAVHCEDE
jgi:hypothetical protein